MKDKDLSEITHGARLGEIKTASELELTRKFEYSYIWCTCSKCDTTKWWLYRKSQDWEGGKFKPICKNCIERKGTFQPGYKLTTQQSIKRSERSKIYYSNPDNYAKLMAMWKKKIPLEPTYILRLCPKCSDVYSTTLRKYQPLIKYCGNCGLIDGNFIGEIQNGGNIGKNRTKDNFIWIECRKCNTHKWTLFLNGKAKSRYCPKCAILLNAERRKGRRIPLPKLRKNRQINHTPPILGEIRFGAEIGRIGASYGKVIWHACEKCGKERWTGLKKGGVPQDTICRSCGRKNKITSASLDTIRKCSKCHQTFPATKEYFYGNDSKLGITSICKHCAVQYQSKRRSNDPKLRLQHAISGEISKSLKGNKKGRHWENLVGYTLQDLMSHIEKQFQPGMTWDNYGNKLGNWSIDHICPVVAYNFKTTNDMDFHRCWSLSNLRPLWHIDNMRKNDKINKPFQPSLALGIKEKQAIYTA